MRSRSLFAACLSLTLSLGLALALAQPAGAIKPRAGQAGAPHAPTADATAQAKVSQLRQAGEAALAAHDYDGAYRSLDAAYRSAPSAELLYPLGQLALAQGRLVEAQDLLRRYLHDTADPAESPGRREAQRVLGLTAPAAGEATIVGERNAMVLVDDHLIGALPLPLPLLLPAGEHRFVIERGALRLEERVSVLAGRLAELRCQFHPGFVVVTFAPALLLLTEGRGVSGEQQRQIEQAVAKAAQSAHLAVVPREAALAQAPKLASCLDTVRCQVELATQNLLPNVLTLRAEVGSGATPDWKLRATLLDAAVGDAAAESTEDCRACAGDRAAQQVRQMVEHALNAGLARPRGKLSVDSTPSGAEVVLGGHRLGVTPYQGAVWAGALQLDVRSPGYKTYSDNLVVEQGRTAKRSVELQKEEPGTPAAPVATHLEILPRPRWRLALGGSVLAAGAGLLAFGISALAINDTCVQDPPMLCLDVYSTTGIGAGLLVGGALLAAGGIALLAVPGKRHEVVVAPSAQAAGFGVRASTRF